MVGASERSLTRPLLGMIPGEAPNDGSIVYDSRLPPEAAPAPAVLAFIDDERLNVLPKLDPPPLICLAVCAPGDERFTMGDMAGEWPADTSPRDLRCELEVWRRASPSTCRDLYAETRMLCDRMSWRRRLLGDRPSDLPSFDWPCNGKVRGASPLVHVSLPASPTPAGIPSIDLFRSALPGDANDLLGVPPGDNSGDGDPRGDDGNSGLIMRSELCHGPTPFSRYCRRVPESRVRLVTREEGSRPLFESRRPLGFRARMAAAASTATWERWLAPYVLVRLSPPAPPGIREVGLVSIMLKVSTARGGLKSSTDTPMLLTLVLPLLISDSPESETIDLDLLMRGRWSMLRALRYTAPSPQPRSFAPPRSSSLRFCDSSICSTVDWCMRYCSALDGARSPFALVGTKSPRRTSALTRSEKVRCAIFFHRSTIPGEASSRALMCGDARERRR
mmetsp:Transcript_20011/g.63696  ORF Transcript_20011/g.63696 Transcript_20011/m.63696 type:complete len:448 (+) Transcript_20011:122-1465(+)